MGQCYSTPTTPRKDCNSDPSFVSYKGKFYSVPKLWAIARKNPTLAIGIKSLNLSKTGGLYTFEQIESADVRLPLLLVADENGDGSDWCHVLVGVPRALKLLQMNLHIVNSYYVFSDQMDAAQLSIEDLTPRKK